MLYTSTLHYSSEKEHVFIYIRPKIQLIQSTHVQYTAIKKSYKRAPNDTTNKIISEEKKIAENLNLSNRIVGLAAKTHS